ncbi:MAG: HAMP domain-containing protein [Reyranella sp.]|nr:HAMP domain-containing protein [Reyranella sp.]
MVTRLSPLRLGLSARLFAVLLLLGAIAVLISGGLGYISARDALEQSIYNQLTAARETKTHQVENYFRSTSNEIRLLANTQMVVEAMHDFRNAVDELDRTKVPDDVRNRVESWYDTHFMPMIRRQLGADAQVRDYLPIASAAYFLQDHYIIANPNRTGQRRALADAGDGSAYSRLHARYHPILRHATATLNLYDLMMIDPRDGRIVYSVTKETDFASSIKAAPYSHSNLAVAVAACSESADASKTCLGDFADYLPADGAPAAFMAAPLIEKGVVIGVLVARLSINELDNIVSGRRQWSHEGFGMTGEAYLVGPDFLIRSAPRLFFENRDQYFEELERGGTTPKNDIEDTHRYGSPVLQQHVDNKATRAALSGLEGIGAIPGTGGQVTLASWGPVSVPGLQWGMIAKIDDAEAFAPVHLLQRRLIIVGAIALLVVLSTGAWLSRSLLGPLRDLTAGVQRFAAGDYAASVRVRTEDEIGQLCSAFNGMVDELREKSVVIDTKNRENEQLLLNVLPAPIASRLRGGEQNIADGFDNITVAFADIVDFTHLSSGMPPARLVELLNALFSRFDEAAIELGVEKIKTVGDAYMLVCGLPVPVPDHMRRVVRMAIRMVLITREQALEHKVALKLRVGINSGPVVAGVIGKSKYIYDLWGDTVNVASRMESTGLPDTIQVTRPVYEELKDDFDFEPRGLIEVKGKGSVEAWILKL